MLKVMRKGAHAVGKKTCRGGLVSPFPPFSLVTSGRGNIRGCVLQQSILSFIYTILCYWLWQRPDIFVASVSHYMRQIMKEQKKKEKNEMGYEI